MDKAQQYAKAAEFYKQALAEGADADEARAAYDAAIARIAAMPEAKPVAPASAPSESLGDFAKGTTRAVGQGVTFGFGDNLEAGVRALSPDVTYKDALSNVRNEQAQFADKHPVVNVGAEIAGGLATGGALRAAAKKGLSMVAGKLVPQAIEGGVSALSNAGLGLSNSALAQGAVAGVGAGNAETLSGDVLNAGIGGGLGWGLGNVIGKVGGKAAEIMQRARGTETARAIGQAGDQVQSTMVSVLPSGNPAGKLADKAVGQVGKWMSDLPQGERAPTLAGRRAVTVLANRMGQGKITPDVLDIAGGANTAQGATILDNMGVQGERTARGLRTLGGEAGEMIDNFAIKRARTYPDRMVDAVRNGKQIDNIVQASKDFIEARKLASTPLYDQFRAMPPIADDPVIEKLLKRPSMKAAMKQAVINERESGTPVQFMQVMVNGKAKKIPVRTPAFLDAVKKAADGKIYTGKTVEGGIAPETLNKMRDTRKEFVARLDDIFVDGQGNKVYKEARDAWAGPTALKAAMNNGKDAMLKAIDPEEMADDLMNMSQSELEMYQRGAAAGIRNRLSEGGLKPGSTEHRAFIDRVENAFGQDANMVLTKIRDEVAATRTAGFITNNSASIDKSVDVVDELVPEKSSVWASALYNPLRTASNLAGRYVGSKIPLFRDTRTETAKLLLSPADNESVIKMLASEYATQGMGKTVSNRVRGPMAAETAFGFFRRPPEEKK